MVSGLGFCYLLPKYQNKTTTDAKAANSESVPVLPCGVIAASVSIMVRRPLQNL
jgi:hypothetical protein